MTIATAVAKHGGANAINKLHCKRKAIEAENAFKTDATVKLLFPEKPFSSIYVCQPSKWN